MKEERKYETVELECDAKLAAVKAMVFGSTPESARAGTKYSKSMQRGQSDGTLAMGAVAPDVKREQERLWKAAKKSKNKVENYTEDDASETPIPFDRNSRQGYESSSTAQGDLVTQAHSSKKLVQKARALQGLASKPEEAEALVEDSDMDLSEVYERRCKEFEKDEGWLDEKDYVNQHPHADQHAVIDTIRFAGIFIYLVDWIMKLAYYEKSKFASIHIRILYADFMVWRCYVIGAYCVFTIALMAHKYWVVYSARDKKSREFKKAGKLTQEEVLVDSAADPDAKLKEIKHKKKEALKWKLGESAVHCCCLEVVMHAGCGRLIGLPSVKTRFWYAALGQELLLH